MSENLENTTSELLSKAFAQEAGKSLVTSAAVTAGMLAGLTAFGWTKNKLEERKARKTAEALNNLSTVTEE